MIGEATLLRESGDQAGAFKLIERAVAKVSSNVTLRYDMGMMAEKLG